MNVNSDWSTAQTDCKSRNASLAIMNTDDEYEFVTNMISSTETIWVILISLQKESLKFFETIFTQGFLRDYVLKFEIKVSLFMKNIVSILF